MLAAFKRADRDHAQGSYERRVISANHGSSNVSCASAPCRDLPRAVALLIPFFDSIRQQRVLHQS